MKNYTLAKITTFYPQYLSAYYKRHNAALTRLSYKDQYRHLMTDAFSWANFYQIHLSKLGITAHEIVANADLLQTTWAKENNSLISSKTNLLLAQLKKLRPQVLFLQDIFIFDAQFIVKIKTEIPTIKLIIGWCAVSFTEKNLETFRACDIMLSCTPHFVKTFQEAGIKSYLLNHAFETTLLSEIQKNNPFPNTDLLFAGTLTSGKGNHLNRLELINQLADSDIELSLRLNLPQQESHAKVVLKQLLYDAYQKTSFKSLFNRLPILKKVGQWGNRPDFSIQTAHLKRYASPPVFGLEYLKALSKSKIGFNSHIDIAGEYAGNVRLFEITGVGSCMVTDWKKNIAELFEPDREIVTYRSTEEAIEKIKWLLEHPAEREKIAKAGQARTLKDHSFAKRAETLNEIICGNLD